MSATPTGTNARRDLAHASEIVATGFERPSLLVDNYDFYSRCRFPITGDRAGLERETRMVTRNWCAPGESTFTMARRAVDMALAQDPALRDQIDLLVAVSSTTAPGFEAPEPDHAGMGELAPPLLRAIGRHHAIGLDVKGVACAGFLRGLQILDGLLANPNYRAGIVVATERCSGLATSGNNRSSFCFILGDAAGAAVLRRRERATHVGLVDHAGQMDTTRYHDMTILPDRASLYVRGPALGAATVEMLVACGRTLLSRNGLTVRDVDWLLPMQTHAGMVETTRDALGWPADRMLWHGDVNGFSGSASIPALLAQKRAEKVIQKGDLVLSLAVGAGLSSAGTLYRA